jgi:hypothetical protein
MITSESECVEVNEAEEKIQFHSDGVMSQHFLTDNGYEASTASEFQLKFIELRKKLTDKITAPELLRLQTKEIKKAS